MQYFSCGSDKYSEIKKCDLEPFSKIRHIFVCNYLPLVDSQEQHDVLSALDEEQQEVEHYSSYLSDHLMSQVAIKLRNFI